MLSCLHEDAEAGAITLPDDLPNCTYVVMSLGPSAITPTSLPQPELLGGASEFLHPILDFINLIDVYALSVLGGSFRLVEGIALNSHTIECFYLSVSRRTSLAFLSSRRAMNLVWRR